MAGAPHRLGKVQQQIMEVLWQRGRASARAITEDLSREKPVAHSTVQTLLRQLEAKGAITHDLEERTFIFRPLVQPTDLRASAASELLSRLFDGSVTGLVAHLLEQRQISRDELNRLRRLIDEEVEP